MGREELLVAAKDDSSQLEGVAAIEVKGNFMFDPASHRDFLGAILGTGEGVLCLESLSSDMGFLSMVAVCTCSKFQPPVLHIHLISIILNTDHVTCAGVVRDRVGDILLQGEAGAQILVDPELLEHLERSLTKVRTVPVETRAIPLQQLKVAAPRVEEISSIEASLRLDAVASAGQ